MRNLIKKILKEEDDDFDWVKYMNTQPTLESIDSELNLGDKFMRESSTNTTWVIIELGKYHVVLDNNSNRYSKINVPRNKFVKSIMVGDWVPVS